MDNPLLDLLTLYLKKEINSKQTLELFKLIDRFLLTLTNVQYKRLQDLWIDSFKERQRIRFDFFLQFVEENRDKTAEWILFSFRRRFHWIEMLVDCKLYGINLFDNNEKLTAQINSSLVRRIILGQNIYNRFVNTKGYEPSDKEFLIEFIKHYLKRGKRIKFSVIESSVRDCLSYFYCKKYADPIQGYREDYDVNLRQAIGKSTHSF